MWEGKGAGRERFFVVLFLVFCGVCLLELAYIRVRVSPASPVWEGEGRGWNFFLSFLVFCCVCFFSLHAYV